jgi:hypothetical protein
MMRRVRFFAIVIPLVAGCGGNGGESITAPTPVGPAQRVQEPPTPPEPSAAPTHLDRYRVASMERGVASQVTRDDFQCDPGWPHYCQGFLLQAPTNGRLDVVMTWTTIRDPYPLDFDVFDPETGLGYYSVGWGAGQRRVTSVPLRAGVSYPVTVWSAWVPGEVFELRFSLRPE